MSGLTIIFLRYDKEDYDTILSFLQSALKTIETDGKNEFITINKNKVRRRKIWRWVWAWKMHTANDSLAPGIEYIKRDMIHLLNTLEWEGERENDYL